MKKTFLFCLVSFISASAFAVNINLKCTSNNDVILDKEIKYISDQKDYFCPDRPWHWCNG